MAQQVKDLVLSLQWLRSLVWRRFDPWTGNFHMLLVLQKWGGGEEERKGSFSWESRMKGQYLGKMEAPVLPCFPVSWERVLSGDWLGPVGQTCPL